MYRTVAGMPKKMTRIYRTASAKISAGVWMSDSSGAAPSVVATVKITLSTTQSSAPLYR